MTLCRLRPSCLALVAAISAFAPPAFAIPIQVLVPVRSPDIPISEFKVMLETPSAVGGTTVGIGTGSVAVPASGETAFTPTGDGDEFKAAGSGNTVIVTVRPNSMLDGGTNKCVYAAGAASKEFTIDWSGTTVNGYRLTSYAAPTLNACTCSSRRIKTNTAFFTGAPPGTNLGRFPMDVILVLDKSGSMASATPGDPMSISKWEALKWAAGQFIATWEVEGSGLGTAGGTGLVNDRVGLVMFSTTPEIVFIGASTMVGRGIAPSGPGHAWQPVIDKLPTFSPGGATALGGGLKAAILAKAPDRDLTVVMMTDGIQNVVPLVNDGSGSLTGFKVLDFGSGEEAIKDKCVPVLTLAMGTAAATQAELLDKVAQQTSGTVRLTVASSTDLAFLSTLVESLKGSTLNKVAQRTGVLPASVIGIREPTAATSPTFGVAVDLDGTVKNAIAVLSWIVPPNSQIAPPTLRFTNPAGTVVPSVATVNGQGFTVQRVDLPSSGAAGSWKVDVLNSFHTSPLPYHVSVYANERNLDFNLRFQEANHGTGEPLTLVAQVSLDGKPMTGLTGLKIVRELPAGAMGTILHDRKGTGSSDGGTDPQSAYDAKLDSALRDPDVLGKAGTIPGDSVTMTEVGGGKYSFLESNTSVPGTYRFHVSLDATAPTGSIHRLETIEAIVDVVPTPQVTSGVGTTVAVNDLGGGSYSFQVIPRDKFGNYAGPGKNVRLISDSGRASGAADQAVTGEYTIGLAGATGDPLIAVAVDGRQVGKKKKLSDWQKGVEPVDAPPPTPICGCLRGGGVLPLAGGLILLFAHRRRQRKRSGADGAPKA